MTNAAIYHVAVATLSIVALVTVVLPPATDAQQSNQCTSGFLGIFGQCTNNTSSAINFQNFLWLTRDGNMGTKPTDLPTFTQQVCTQKELLYECGKAQVARIKNAAATLCTDVDKTNVEQFFRAVFKSLNTSCAHPCRSKLLASLRTCFETSGVNPDLFMSNVSKPRYNILGEADGNITLYCDKKEALIECMRTNIASCPDTYLVLPATGLDIDTLNQTITLLCDNRQIYKRGIKCAANRSLAEEACQTKLMREMVDVEQQFQNLNISLTQYTTDICRLRLDNIRCDLNALEKRTNGTQCDDVILGLRREQECTLIPLPCQNIFSDRLIDMCNPKLFDRKDRAAFTSRFTSNGSARHGLAFIVLATAILFGLFFSRRDAL